MDLTMITGSTMDKTIVTDRTVGPINQNSSGESTTGSRHWNSLDSLPPNASLQRELKRNTTLIDQPMTDESGQVPHIGLAVIIGLRSV